MKTSGATLIAIAVLAVAGAHAQYPTPKINDRTPAPLVPPTEPPGPKEYHPKGHELLPTATPLPTRTATRTPTPTPVPPQVRLFDIRSSEIASRPERPSSSCRVKADISSPEQPSVNLHCDVLPPVGLRADFDLWKGVTLKNGWKVKNLNASWTGASNPQPPDNRTGFSVSRSPVAGSTDPSTTIHLFASPGGTIDVLVELRVEGPQGTNPR